MIKKTIAVDVGYETELLTNFASCSQNLLPPSSSPKKVFCLESKGASEHASEEYINEMLNETEFQMSSFSITEWFLEEAAMIHSLIPHREVLVQASGTDLRKPSSQRKKARKWDVFVEKLRKEKDLG